MSIWNVKTHVYEGPLDVLLELIENRKLFINEISLAQITDDFIKFIENHPEFPVDQSSEFILIASTLLLIKSRSLLPNIQLTPEEEVNIHELEIRLEHYKIIKEISLGIKHKFGKEIMFPKSTKTTFDIVFLPDKNMSLVNILTTLKDIIQRITEIPNKIPEATVRKIVSLEETIDKLLSRVKQNMTLKFSDFSGIGKVEKVNVIVSFLAMLELVKRGVIIAKQENHGGEIELNNDSLNTPTYINHE